MGVTSRKRTLLVTNLNTKIRKGILVRSLRDLCSAYGDVHAIYYRRKQSLKGTAFVSFRDLNQAANALALLDETSFFCKPLIVRFANTETSLVTTLFGKNKNESDPVFTVQSSGAPVSQSVGSGTTVFVQNIPVHFTADDIKEISSAGVTGVTVVPGRGQAFVAYGKAIQAKAAIDHWNSMVLEEQEVIARISRKL